MSRIIGQDAAQAFAVNHDFKRSNTEVFVGDDETQLYLHNNLIAKKNETGVWITTAGWGTKTTMARLNAILDRLGVPIYVCQRDYACYLAIRDYDRRIEVRIDFYQWQNVADAVAKLQDILANSII